MRSAPARRSHPPPTRPAPAVRVLRYEASRVFFKWKSEKVYSHAAVVRANSRGEIHLVQHGIKELTTLSDVIARYKKKDPIEKVLIVRVKDR